MNNKNISRRNFLKKLGLAGIASTALGACVKDEAEQAAEAEYGTMTYRSNPKTGDKVSLLGFGMMRLPSVGGRSAREGNEDIDQDEVNRMVDYAIEHGVNLFDTSPAYCKGFSEAATGKALSRYPRDKYFVSTKLSNFAPQTWTREASIEMYHNSLKNLQVDYLDYMLLHSLGRNAEKQLAERYLNNGVLDYLVAEREAGRIRNLGFSFHGDAEGFDFLMSLHEKYHWDFVLIQMNYMDWRNANESNTNAEYLYGELEKRGIPVLIMEPLLGGRLAEVPGRVVKKFKQRNPESSVASWAFRFCGTHTGVLSVLSGMSKMEHLQDNLHTFSPLKPLNEEELNFLQETATDILRFENIPCTNCKYCMPCPYGLDIPGILRHYNKCINEGHVSPDSQSEGYREARRAFLIGYDRSVPRLRQANHCIGCGICRPHCPQRIDIPAELQKIDQYVESLRTSE